MSRAMKDSGVAWIGEIPETWKVLPAQRGFTEVKKKNTDGVVQNALQFKFGLIIPKTNFDANDDDYVADTILSYTVVEPGTVMINGLNLNYDFKTQRTGLVKETGIITSAYLALWPNQRLITPEFATYLFKGYETRMALHNMGAGIRLTLGYKEFKKQPVLFPPIQEQKLITTFLDRRCAEIDRVIATTKSTIEEYKKLKQSIITEAVTHGVRGPRKMKDSGVEWIGEIPEEWRTAKLKYFANIRSGITLGKVYPKGTELFEFPYLRVANVQGGHVKLDDIATIMVTKEESLKYRLKVGELLMTEGGDRDKLGRGTVWHGEIEPCLHQNHVFALNSDSHRLKAEYIEYLSTSFVGRDYFDVTANQSVHLASTNSTTILNFTIPCPSIDEQIEIVAFLNSRCTQIEQMIETKQQLLTQLESYKKSVIYEFVTGKQEVPM